MSAGYGQGSVDPGRTGLGIEGAPHQLGMPVLPHHAAEQGADEDGGQGHRGRNRGDLAELGGRLQMGPARRVAAGEVRVTARSKDLTRCSRSIYSEARGHEFV